MANDWSSLGGNGRKRGERVDLRVRIPSDLKAAIDQAARDTGIPITDWVALALARRLGVPDPGYINVPDGSAPPDELELGLPDRRERPRISA